MDVSKKTPLQLLAQTCQSIGMPDPPSKSKSIQPLLDPVKPPKTFEKSEKKDSKDDKDKSYSPNGSTHGSEGHKSPKNDVSKVTIMGQPSAVGQALPPTLPPTGVAPKCGGCVTPYPGSLLGSYPLMPPSSSAGLYASGLPGPTGPPGVYSASLHAAAAAAAATLPPFMPPCREPYCRVCPPGGGLALPTGATAPLHNGRCAGIGCYCGPSAHDLYLLSAANHPLLSSFPGLPPPGLPSPAVSMAAFPAVSFGSLYNPALVAMAGNVTSPPGGAVPPSIPAPAPPTTTATLMCNWETCGKRFANSDELREHLNTHVQQQDGTKSPPQPERTVTTAASPPNAATPPSTVSAAQSTTPGSTTPASSVVTAPAAPPALTLPTPTLLPRPYSPRSMLAASFNSLSHRYHPYKTPGTLGTALPGPLAHMPFPMNPVTLGGYPGLGSLYGQRLPGSLPH